MGEEPHHVTLIEIVGFHDLLPVSFDPLEEDKLVHAHFADDVGEKGERDFDHRMKSDKAADAGVHLLDRQGGVAAAEGMHPAPGGDGLGHQGRRLVDVPDLGCLDFVHDPAGIVQPFVCQHVLLLFIFRIFVVHDCKDHSHQDQAGRHDDQGHAQAIGLAKQP